MTIGTPDQIVSPSAIGGSPEVTATQQQSPVLLCPERAPSSNSPASYRYAGDYFHALLRNLGWPGTGSTRRVRTIGLTSCYGGEGVSTMAIHTAIAAAESGNHNVLLVDANISAPRVHDVLDLPLSPGLGEALSASGPHKLAVRRTRQSNLSVLTAGVGQAGRVYEAGDNLAALFDALKKKFDLVLFDMPATSEASSALHLFRLFDGVVLVVENERVRSVVAQKATENLRRAGANLLGVVLNKRNKHIPDWLYQRL